MGTQVERGMDKQRSSVAGQGPGRGRSFSSSLCLKVAPTRDDMFLLRPSVTCCLEVKLGGPPKGATLSSLSTLLLHLRSPSPTTALIHGTQHSSCSPEHRWRSPASPQNYSHKPWTSSCENLGASHPPHIISLPPTAAAVTLRGMGRPPPPQAVSACDSPTAAELICLVLTRWPSP